MQIRCDGDDTAILRLHRCPRRTRPHQIDATPRRHRGAACRRKQEYFNAEGMASVDVDLPLGTRQEGAALATGNAGPISSQLQWLSTAERQADKQGSRREKFHAGRRQGLPASQLTRSLALPDGQCATPESFPPEGQSAALAPASEAAGSGRREKFLAGHRRGLPATQSVRDAAWRTILPVPIICPAPTGVPTGAPTEAPAELPTEASAKAPGMAPTEAPVATLAAAFVAAPPPESPSDRTAAMVPCSPKSLHS